MDSQFFTGLLISIIAGLGWGSFATSATYRIPRNIPWVSSNPYCPLCKHELNILDYFSILSFFIHRGVCRHCKGTYKAEISDFITELSITVLFIVGSTHSNFGDLYFLITLMVVGFVILSVIDAEHKFIPSQTLISVLLIGIMYRMHLDKTFYGVVFGGITALLIGLAIRTLYFTLIGKKDIAADFTKSKESDRFNGEGFDYVKLLGIIGVWLNFIHFVIFVIFAGITILAWSLISKKTLRIGSIMGSYALLMIMFPDFIDKIAISLGLL